MGKGKITLSQIVLELGIQYEHILDFQIENKENEHGKMILLLEMSEETQLQDIMPLKGTQITAKLPEGDILFCGICRTTAFNEQTGYKNLGLEVCTHTINMDETKRTETYQSPFKKLGDVVGGISQKYNSAYYLQKNPAIATVLYQKDETDWEFIKRLANQYNQQIYAESRDEKTCFAIGTNGMRTQDEENLGQKLSTSKDIAELRLTKVNVDSNVAGYQFECEEFLCNDLTVSAGDTIGTDTVKRNSIINNGGILENRILVAKTAETHASYEATVSNLLVSNVLTGTVKSVMGNMLQVQFDDDAEDMAGKRVDVPYESAISNSFYCMPDEEDRVFVYYENNGKIVCLGSKRSNTEHPDFQNPKEKSLTSNDKMLRFTEKAVKLTTTRKLHDEKEDTEISIILDDDDGINITSGEDIRLETKDGMNIVMSACESEEVLMQLLDALMKGQEKFLELARAGNKIYVSESGRNWLEEKLAAAWLKTKQELKDLGNNFVDTFTFKNLRQCFGWVKKEELFIPDAMPEDQYSTGVVTIYGLNAVTMQVASSIIVLDIDVFIGANAFNWLGYTRGEHAIETEEYQDGYELFLDIVQLGLDIVGLVFPVCDIVNAAISLLRGDVAGALMSIVAIIPAIGDAAKLGTTFPKLADKINSAPKFLKVMKYTDKIMDGYDMIEAIPTIYLAYKEIIKDPGFDVNDGRKVVEIVGAVFSLLKPGAEKIVDKVKSKKSNTNPDGPDSPNTPDSQKTDGPENPDAPDSQKTDGPENPDAPDSQKTDGPENPDAPDSQKSDGTDDPDTPESKKDDGPEDSKKTSEKTSDPINVITGSLLAEYVDLSIEDILSSYDLKRYYESAFDNRGGILGDKWRFGIESSVKIQDEHAVVQLPDLHLEKFSKREGSWINVRRNDKSCILVETEEGYVFRNAGSKIAYEYNTKGQMTCITDSHGNRTEMMYSGGMLERIQVASGRWILFRYQDGKVCELEDNIGRKVQYTYQGNYLHTATLPNGGTMRYEYTKEGFISCAYDLNGKWYTKNFYDRKGRVIRQELAGGEEYVVFYDDVNKQNTFLTTSDGNRIIYEYGNEKLPRKIIYPDQTTVEKRYDSAKNVVYEKDRMGNETFRTFDENGMILEERMPDGLVRCYEYDVNNYLIKMSDNSGRETLCEYDVYGNMMSSKIRIDRDNFQITTFEHDSKGRITSMTDAEGNTEYYTYDLPISSPTKYITSAGNVIRYSYDEAGRLMEVEDELGKKSYGYNNFGQRIIVRDEEGNVTRFYYDNMANLVKKVRPNAYDALSDEGDGTVYEYDVWKNLTRVINPDGGINSYENDFYGKVLSESDENGVRKYEYDADHNRIRSIYPNGAVIRENFDANGNLTKRILPEQYDISKDDGAGYTYEYDSSNRLLQITNSLGVVEHRYVYNLAGYLVKDIDAKGYLSADTDEERIGTLYQYNLIGLVTEIRKPLEIAQNEVVYHLVTYRYDKYGNCIEEKRYQDYQTKDSAKGRVNSIHYSYDKANRLVRINDSLGACMEYGYNCRNQKALEKRKIAEDIWQERHYFYSPAGRIERIMDSADEKGCGRKYTPTYLYYDKNGNVVCIKTASGYEILREYDNCDRVISETHRDKNGDINNRTEYTYNHAGNITEKRQQDGYTVNFCYDSMGRLTDTKESNGAVEHRKYDLNGSLVGVIHPLENGKQTGFSYSYDVLGRNTEVTALDGTLLHYTRYNTFGEKEQEGDNIGSIRCTYDFAGRRILAETDAGSTQAYEYDAAGNIIALKDGNGNRTIYETDLWGRITRTGKADGSYETYDYDHAGNIIAAIDGNGNKVCYRYNSLNRMSARIDSAGCEENFLYDIEGRLSEHIDREGRRELYRYNMYGSPVLHQNAQAGLTESWEYDSMGQLKSAIGGGMRYEYTYYQGGLLKEKKASGKVLISYEYDVMRRKIAQTDLTGKRTEYRYNTHNMLEDVVENGIVLAHYGYYPDETLKSLTVGSYVHTEYTYDLDKNKASMTTTLDGTLLADNSYSYDKNGNRTKKQGLDGLTKFSYDVNNRLVEVEYPFVLSKDGANCYEKLVYDNAGNRILRTTESLTEQYSYDNCNRLLELKTTYADASRPEEIKQYVYDRQGNLLSDGKMEYSYDDFNRVVEITSADGNRQVNRYDAEGLRHEMEENGELVQFLYSGREVVAEKESDGNIVRYIRGLGLIVSDSEKARTYYHYVSDEQGSITHVVEGDSKETFEKEHQAEHKILNRYTYDAFGNTLECKEEVHNRFRYLGEQYDPVTQQYYLRARYYNPVIGRFTQEDTYYGDGLNLYQYCANNPVRYKDPSGHGSVEQDPYKCFIDVGADPETAKLAAMLYPDYDSKKHLVKKYLDMGYNAENALMLANREIIYGEASTEKYAESNVPKGSQGQKNSDKAADKTNSKPPTNEKSSKNGKDSANVMDKLVDGSRMNIDDVMDLATEFLGEGYSEPVPGSGRFVSADGTRVFRMGDNDILGKHGGGRHVNFEILAPNPNKPGKMQVITDIHIYLEDT